MGQTLGDGIVALAVAAVFLGYWYFKHRERQRRLEILHQERLTAMDKGIPLPELPIDPPPVRNPASQHVPLILGIVLFAFGTGLMIALRLIVVSDLSTFWPLPLPVALMGLGLLLYSVLTGSRER
jgi:Domain of unknown function (DUF6249)